MANLFLPKPGRSLLSGIPAGFDAQTILNIVKDDEELLFVARDDIGLARMANSLSFFGPDLDVISFPAWDCLPYDRVSPNNHIIRLRIETLYDLLIKKR